MSKEKDVAVDESWGPRLAAGLGFQESWKSNMCCESCEETCLFGEGLSPFRRPDGRGIFHKCEVKPN